MEMPGKAQEIGAYLNQHFTCSCGRSHYAPVKKVSIKKGALENLPVFAKELGFRKLYLISDAITYDIAGKRCMALLQNAGIDAQIHILQYTGYDEATIGEILFDMPLDYDLAVAVGTGSINDMTRFFSHRTGRPFFTVATAAPMDGFASSISALNINHLKTTVGAQSPTAIIGDTDILKSAPYQMIAAGLGDLMGKFTCLCDWKISKVITGEHYCENIVALVEDCIQNVLKDADQAVARKPRVLGDIMNGLVLTGVAMSLYGNSRPASGCEHHMSHYWEMMFEQAGEKPAAHGIQVGVATVLVLKAVEALRRYGNPNFTAARRYALTYDFGAWIKQIRTAYGNAADGIIAIESEAQKNNPEQVLSRIEAMEAHWDEITMLLQELPSASYMEGLLRELQAPTRPEDIGVSRELLKNTLLYCKEVRPRYTFLQMLWDLGILEEIAETVVQENYESHCNEK